MLVVLGACGGEPASPPGGKHDPTLDASVPGTRIGDAATERGAIPLDARVVDVLPAGAPETGAGLADARQADAAYDSSDSGSNRADAPEAGRDAPDGGSSRADALAPDAERDPADAPPSASDGPPAGGCPGPEAYVGNPTWARTVQATGQALYCIAVHDSRTLKEELALKAQVRVAAGTYRLPGPGVSSVPFALPMCLLRRDTAPVAAGTGTIQEAQTSLVRFAQPVGPNGLKVMTWGDTVDGSRDSLSIQLCWGGDCDRSPFLYFDSCTFEGVRPSPHRVVFLGGDVVDLELRIDRNRIGAGTEPSAFVRASGTLRGVPFDQRDYFKLVYQPSHHHFQRQFAVLFDAPIAGACGIEIGGLDLANEEPDFAYTVDCALDRISPLQITQATITR